MGERVFAAVDIGASGGRVVAGVVAGGRVALHEVHRFPNGCRLRDGHLRWDLSTLCAEVLAGLAKVPEAESIGIDTWAVDYGLLDEDGCLLAEPVAYRDGRTARVVDRVHERIAPDELYGITGIQHLPFNTLYQLAAERDGPLWERAAHVVLLPDLIAHRLTGALRSEATNASTTGLVDVGTGDWSDVVLERLGIPRSLLPPIEQPGAVRGVHHGTVVTTVGSHDTASAVVGVPGEGSFAYVASGTWSLVGLELDEPNLADPTFTNERGVDGRIRYLRNVGGLWLLQECLRDWPDAHLPTLLEEAAAVPGGPTVDVDDVAFIAPGGMPARIAAAAGRSGMSRAETVRCVLDSLAAGYRTTVDRARTLTGRDVEVVHVVGGGSQNELLCRLTADACGTPVVAGPVEATALGNVLVQARARGALHGTLEDLRGTTRASVALRRYEPA